MAFVLFVAAFMMHESPRYLQKIGKIDEAGACLAELLGTSIHDAEVQTCLLEWKQSEARGSAGVLKRRALSDKPESGFLGSQKRRVGVQQELIR